MKKITFQEYKCIQIKSKFNLNRNEFIELLKLCVDDMDNFKVHYLSISMIDKIQCGKVLCIKLKCANVTILNYKSNMAIVKIHDLTPI